MDLSTLRKTLPMPAHMQARVDAAIGAFDKATTPGAKAEARQDMIELHAELTAFLNAAMAHAAFCKCVGTAANRSLTAGFYGAR